MPKQVSQNSSSMNEGGDHKNSYIVYGVLLSVIALIALIIVSSRADDTSQTAGVTNSAPSIDSVTLTDEGVGQASSDIELTESSTKTVYIHGEASDPNGCEDIDTTEGASLSSWTVVLYRTNVAGAEACTPDAENCYTVTPLDVEITGCTPGGTDTDLDYDFSVDLQYYTDATDAGTYSATDWTAYVYVEDEGALSSSDTTTQEVITLTALDVEATIAYGSVALNSESAEVATTITNTGNNQALSAEISQTDDWTCTIGTIDKGQVQWKNVTGGTYGVDMTSVTASAADMSFSIDKYGHTPTDDFYTILKLPETGVGGSCTSTLTVTGA